VAESSKLEHAPSGAKIRHLIRKSFAYHFAAKDYRRPFWKPGKDNHEIARDAARNKTYYFLALPQYRHGTHLLFAGFNAVKTGNRLPSPPVHRRSQRAGLLFCRTYANRRKIYLEDMGTGVAGSIRPRRLMDLFSCNRRPPIFTNRPSAALRALPQLMVTGPSSRPEKAGLAAKDTTEGVCRRPLRHDGYQTSTSLDTVAASLSQPITTARYRCNGQRWRRPMKGVGPPAAVGLL